MPDAIIIIPTVDDAYFTEDAQLLSGIAPWMGPEYVRFYAEVKGGYEVRVIYQDLEGASAVEQLIDAADITTLVGISVTAVNYGNAVRFMERAHRRGMRVAIGGPHIRIAWPLILKHRPYALCITGQGEEAMLRLLDDRPNKDIPSMAYVDGGVVRRNPDGEPANYEELPLINPTIDYQPFFKRWLAANASLYDEANNARSVSIRGNKGCAKKVTCAFCSVERMESFDPETRGQRVWLERADAVERYGNGLFIRECNDDTPTDMFLEELARRGAGDLDACVYTYSQISPLVNTKRSALLRRAGYTHVLLGVESYNGKYYDVIKKSKTTLEQLRKVLQHTRSMGLNFYLSGILGWAGETATDLELTRRHIEEFLEHPHVKGIAIAYLFLYPNTDLFNRLMAVPGRRERHLERENGDIVDYRAMYEDWLATFTELSIEQIQSSMSDICKLDSRINYITGFVS
jgi:radical SAM superfamily enzyme YgiQ (UPF0313 family)